MGLFDKKYCDICGDKIGLLGNRKLEDGNCCKECAKKLSPFMTDRRESTVQEIKEHLAYREANRARLNSVVPTRTIGNGYTRVYICDGSAQFFVTSSQNWQNANPDLISLSQVVSCDINVQEHRTEIMRTDKDGKRVSYTPPHYEYSYEFLVHIAVNSPYFSDIRFELTPSGARPNNRFSDDFHRYDLMADELRRALQPQLYQQAAVVEMPVQQAAPVQQMPDGAWQCACGAVNTGNFCTQCGSKKPEAPKPRFCSNCGWTPGENAELPKFCPQCGTKFPE